MTELHNKIQKHKKTLETLDKSSHQYIQLAEYIKELEKALPKKEIKLHVAEESICTSCE